MEHKIQGNSPSLERLSDDLYNKAPGVRATQLKTIISRSPAHSLVEKVQTSSMLLGTQVHTALLEQERIVLSPKFDRRTKEGKAASEAFMKENEGKLLLDPDDYELVKGMADAIHAHSDAGKLLTGGKTEIGCFWNESGIDCKSKFDFVDEKRRILVDLKTCRDASPKGFARQIANFHYHLQAAHYLSGVFHATGTAYQFLIVAVETEAPYAVAVYELDFGTLEKGEDLRQKALEIYRQCKATNEWPAYPPGIHQIAIPSWAFEMGEE